MFLIASLGACSSRTDNSFPAVEESNKAVLPSFNNIATSEVKVYECGDGDTLQLTAHVTKDSTWLFLPDTSLKVLPVSSGSGARYEAKSYLFWSKGNEALLQRPRGALMSCTKMPQKSSWQAARLRGVHFRALGHEPGWTVEIFNSGTIRYVGRYGRDSLRAPVSKSAGSSGKIAYHARTKSPDLKIEIMEKPCSVPAGHTKFPFTVLLFVDGNRYRGCGKYLD